MEITVVDIGVEFKRMGITSIDLSDVEVTSILAKAIVEIMHKTYRNDDFFHNNEEASDSLGYAQYLDVDVTSIVELHLKEVDVCLNDEDLVIVTKTLLKVIQRVTGWSKDSEQHNVDFYKVVSKKNIVIFRNIGSIYVSFWRELHGK